MPLGNVHSRGFRFSSATGTRAVAVHTYFHGTILSAEVPPSEPVRVGVEWGKHGSLPLDRDGKLASSPANLRAHWARVGR